MDIYLKTWLVIIGITIIHVLIARISNKKYLEEYKKMTEKTIATITKIDTEEEEYYDSESNQYKKTNVHYANYTFIVNSKTYFGNSKLPVFANKKTIKVLYNPENPQKNVSLYKKRKHNGTSDALAVLITTFIILGLPLIIIYLI